MKIKNCFMSGGGMMANSNCFSFVFVSANPHCCVRLLSVFGFVFLQPAQSKPVVGPPEQIQWPLLLFRDSLNFMPRLPRGILHMKREFKNLCKPISCQLLSLSVCCASLHPAWPFYIQPQAGRGRTHAQNVQNLSSRVANLPKAANKNLPGQKVTHFHDTLSLQILFATINVR